MCRRRNSLTFRVFSFAFFVFDLGSKQKRVRKKLEEGERLSEKHFFLLFAFTERTASVLPPRWGSRRELTMASTEKAPVCCYACLSPLPAVEEEEAAAATAAAMTKTMPTSSPTTNAPSSTSPQPQPLQPPPLLPPALVPAGPSNSVGRCYFMRSC